jgi:hypothetical protein
MRGVLWVELWVGLFGRIPRKPLKIMVGATGFEPVTSTV